MKVYIVTKLIDVMPDKYYFQRCHSFEVVFATREEAEEYIKHWKKSNKYKDDEYDIIVQHLKGVNNG